MSEKTFDVPMTMTEIKLVHYLLGLTTGKFTKQFGQKNYQSLDVYNWISDNFRDVDIHPGYDLDLSNYIEMLQQEQKWLKERNDAYISMRGTGL